MGEARALDIYRAFILDIIGMLKKGNHSLTIAFYPEDSEKAIVDWLGKGFVYMPQRGNDLGQRMENAFVQSFSKGFGRVALLGKD